jgi:hypothetical protein
VLSARPAAGSQAAARRSCTLTTHSACATYTECPVLAGVGRARLALALRALLRPAHALRLLLLRPVPTARAPDLQPDNGLVLSCTLCVQFCAISGGSRLHALLWCQALGERRRGRRVDMWQAQCLASRKCQAAWGLAGGQCRGRALAGRGARVGPGFRAPALGGLAPLALARGLLLSLRSCALLRGPGGRARARPAALRAARVGAAARAGQLVRAAGRRAARTGGTAGRLGHPARTPRHSLTFLQPSMGVAWRAAMARVSGSQCAWPGKTHAGGREMHMCTTSAAGRPLHRPERACSARALLPMPSRAKACDRAHADPPLARRRVSGASAAAVRAAVCGAATPLACRARVFAWLPGGSAAGAHAMLFTCEPCTHPTQPVSCLEPENIFHSRTTPRSHHKTSRNPELLAWQERKRLGVS